MSATNFTPIQLYRTSTAAAVPTAGNLAAGELAINLTDEALYFKNAAGVVTLLADSSGALGSVTSVDVSGGTTGLTTSGGPITSSGTITLAGTLGVANGGTGTATAFTAGSVVFAGASGVYSQDNANLFWDNANDRLGIGTASPATTLAVNGQTRSTSLDAIGALASFASGGGLANFYSGSGIGVIRAYSNNAGAAGTLTFNASGAENMRIDSAGNFLLGASTQAFAEKFRVFGNYSVFDNGTYTGFIGAGNSLGTATATDFAFRSSNAMAFLTGGATERMRIDGSGNVGIGTASPSDKLEVFGGNVRSALVGTSAATLRGFVMASDTTEFASLKASASTGETRLTAGFSGFGGFTTFYTNGSERMRITSAGDLIVGGTTGNGRITARGAGTTGSTYSFEAATSGGATRFIVADNGEASFYNSSSALSMRIGSTGDVSIGTTSGGAGLYVVPRASIPYSIFDTTSAGFGYSAFSFNGTSYGFIGQATGLLGTGTNTDLAIRANANMLFGIGGTERMRIDSSGNVMVGGVTALQSAKITAYGSVAAQNGGVDGTFANAFVGVYSTNSNEHNAIQTSVSSTGTNSGFRFKASDGGGASTTTTVLDLTRTLTIFYTGGSERARIDSSGNVAIGTTTPVSKLHVNNSTSIATYITAGNPVGGTVIGVTAAGASNIATYASNVLTFGNYNSGGAASEFMRLDSSGNLLVGKTAVSITTVGGEMRSDGGVSSTRAGSTSATSTMEVYSTGAAAYRFYVNMAGTIFATSTTISAISDIRLKENVRDLDTGLDTILALKPRRFDWKEGKGKDVKDDMGFIAQEVETVLPELIGGWKAGEGEPDDLKSVKAGDLIPVLVKAIQELTARVAQLEGN